MYITESRVVTGLFTAEDAFYGVAQTGDDGVGLVFKFQRGEGRHREQVIRLVFLPGQWVLAGAGAELQVFSTKARRVIGDRQPDEAALAGVGKVRANFHRGVNLLTLRQHRQQVVEGGNFAEQCQLAVERRIVVDHFRFQLHHIAITAERTVGVNTANMLEVDATAIDARVKAVGHVLNILLADIAAIAGITGDADAKPFRNFFSHFVRCPELGYRVGCSFPTQPFTSYLLRKCTP